jgi:uncharacterized protein involved in exopolysaccharide biosynthesis
MSTPQPSEGVTTGATTNSPAGTLTLLAQHWRSLSTGAVLGGMLGIGLALVLPPTYTARTAFVSPQPQTATAGALASLGSLSSIAGAAAGIRSPIDQYVSLLQSETVADRIIDRFSLRGIYDKDLRTDARKELWKRLRVTPGKKDNLIVLEVDDGDAKRAAEMANAFVDELRKISHRLNLTEAQQRRAFFEDHLEKSRERLSAAQSALQASGFNSGALKNEPKSAAEAYARLKAQIAAAEVALQATRRSLNDNAVEVQQQAAALSSMREQLRALEQPEARPVSQDYVSSYREFKYQETLFEIYSRQFELARLDESRDGLLFQVIDPALPPERRSKPKRSMVALGGMVVGILLAAVFAFRPQRQTRPDPR